MICSGFAGGIACQINIGAVMHASTTTRDDDYTSADVSTFDTTRKIEIPCGLQQFQQSDGKKIVGSGVDFEGHFPTLFLV